MLSKSASQVERLKSQLHSIKQRVADESETIIDTGAMVASGAALGAADEKWGADAVMGASPSLAVGVVATGAALMGYGGQMQPLLLSVGRAGLTVEAARWGARAYREWSERDASDASGS